MRKKDKQPIPQERPTPNLDRIVSALKDTICDPDRPYGKEWDLMMAMDRAIEADHLNIAELREEQREKDQDKVLADLNAQLLQTLEANPSEMWDELRKEWRFAIPRSRDQVPEMEDGSWFQEIRTIEKRLEIGFGETAVEAATEFAAETLQGIGSPRERELVAELLNAVASNNYKFVLMMLKEGEAEQRGESCPQS